MKKICIVISIILNFYVAFKRLGVSESLLIEIECRFVIWWYADLPYGSADGFYVNYPGQSSCRLWSLWKISHNFSHFFVWVSVRCHVLVNRIMHHLHRSLTCINAYRVTGTVNNYAFVFDSWCSLDPRCPLVSTDAGIKPWFENISP